MSKELPVLSDSVRLPEADPFVVFHIYLQIYVATMIIYKKFAKL